MPAHRTSPRRLVAIALATLVAAGSMGVAREALAEPATGENTEAVYRLYNPYDPQHLFTTDVDEYESRKLDGWEGEGIVWYAPKSSGVWVSRLYNQWTGEHLFSSDQSEIGTCVDAGWTLETESGFFSSEGEERPITRLYNPYAKEDPASAMDAHLLSVDEGEIANLKAAGWIVEAQEVPVYAAALPGELVEPEPVEPVDPVEPVEPVDPVEPVEPNDPQEPGEIEDPLYEQRIAVVEYARQFLGWPYVYAGESPEEGGFDCSGLVQYVYKHFGYDLPRTTYNIEAYLKRTGAWKTNIEDMKVGDVLVMSYNSGHVGIFCGKDPETGRYMMIDAGNYTTGVIYRELFYYYHPEYNGPLLGGGSIF